MNARAQQFRHSRDALGVSSAPAARGADPSTPRAQGLYDPANEHDSCGVGVVVDMNGRKSHDILQKGLQILINLDHRGAVGADAMLGDGCGVLTQIPHAFFALECEKLGLKLPEPGHYAIGQFFMPRDAAARAEVEAIVEEAVVAEGQTVIGWRDIPVDNSGLGERVKAVEPVQRQIFIGRRANIVDEDAFELKLFILRKVVSSRVYAAGGERLAEYYPVSLSCRTIVYKGMVLVRQLAPYYKDLLDPRFETALALVHQRFATNTFPSWRLAHPYRMVAHNGEINTLRGNVNWMAARQASVDSELFGNDISKLWPISYEGQSDTACFDNALEFLVRGGYSLAHAMMMLIPEAWAGNPLMDEERRAFYEYHAALMEPWDGPAAMAFTDGRQIGATLDRNGLRPARYFVTDDGLFVLASEMGVLPVPEETIVAKWRLQPGKMLLVDLSEHRIVSDDELKQTLSRANPYRQWLKKTQIVLEELNPVEPRASRTDVSLLDRQQAFGYSQEDLAFLLSPMATTGQEPVGSMGADTPISALSDKSKLLYTYFKQNFAQVTNPPIDPIREELVMSLVSFIGPRPNLFDLAGNAKRKRLEVRQPILTNEDLEKIRCIGHFEDSFDTKTLDITYAVERGAAGMEEALQRLCERAEAAVLGRYNIITLSDRMVGPDRIPIPALLATAAVHHHLIRKGLRTAVGLVVQTGEAREVHHFACLAGYGAEAINPYLAFETLTAMAKDLPEEVDAHEFVKRYIKAIDKGLLKVMSKMGISTYQSYCGAQIFDAVGLSKAFVDKFFFGTATRIEGAGLCDIAEETARRHAEAFGESPVLRTTLDVGGEYAFRLRGEAHCWTPQTVALLQHAVRGKAGDKYQAYAKLLNEQSEHLLTIRGLFRLRDAEEDGRQPAPLAEVEPAVSIVKRFATGAMSFGSISREAHTTLAIAMNRIGGKSNTGEGGEEPERFKRLANGDSTRSAIKQVASGRFGVTTEYLVNADMIQIKMAQGAKPGEGGQLPGHKVDAVIAKVRHSMPGVGLISPPPHHDIYSIEDLAQLIHDLKNANPAARVHVKLVSEVGVGTVAAGVSKAHADVVLISGHDGGTGAAPLTSLKHAGAPWELGLAETQQTLLRNKLRDRIVVQADGQLKTGRDVIIAALLGAEEFGFASAPLVVSGCVMMRVCHLDTCPVGVATQNPELRARFTGRPEFVVNFFEFIAEEVREYLARLGFRRLEEIIGRVDLLDAALAVEHWKASGLDLSRVLYVPPLPEGAALTCKQSQDHGLDKALDHTLIQLAEGALEEGRPVRLELPIRNVNRTVGTMLGYEVTRRWGGEGLPENTIDISFRGSAGQSFGAFLPHGVTLRLEGDANDYLGKGLSGGRLIVRPPAEAAFTAEDEVIAGNVIGYGATGGEIFLRGIVGERFCVRNSGALAVAEGTGDHGCEYMTGGRAVILGPVGRNFAAGMSGGIAYVLDLPEIRVNMEMVDLDRVDPEEAGDHSEGKFLREVVERHHAETGSAVAARLLADWDPGRFTKVMPKDYKRVLSAASQAEREGRDVNEAVMAAAHG
ncbi:MAG: glutamate synthase large subunit [Streptosporangiaceae bacterium]